MNKEVLGTASSIMRNGKEAKKKSKSEDLKQSKKHWSGKTAPFFSICKDKVSVC